MGYKFSLSSINALLEDLSKEYLLFAPKRFEGQAPYSDLDSIRYGEVQSIEEMELDKKSHYSMKEVFYPISETLFYFTENTVTESEPRFQKEALVFLRSCDLHSVKRLDAIYLENKFADHYYKRLRDKIKFVLIGCPEAYENCFCVDMETNKSDDYSASIDRDGDVFYMDVRDEDLNGIFERHSEEKLHVEPSYVT